MNSLSRNDSWTIRLAVCGAMVIWAAALAGCDSGPGDQEKKPADTATSQLNQDGDRSPTETATTKTESGDRVTDPSTQNADSQADANTDQGHANAEEQQPGVEEKPKLVSGDDKGFESPLDDIPLPEEQAEVHTIDIPASWKRLGKEHEIWIDTDNKQVIAGGIICLNRGALEMFICPLYTKEHESVIAVNAKSSQVHAALLALGITPGKPVQWEPEYTPVTGPKLKITVMWKDENDQLVKRDSREMVREFKSKKEMEVDWVFGGSQFYTHTDGTEVYLAESGELVCVSNFATATIDVPIKSSDANMNLLYEANTEKIPDIGTKVYVTFEQLAESEPKSESNDGE